MIDKIFNTRWHLMRWIRLGIGLYAVANMFFVEFNIFFLLFGMLFLYQALFDTGCGGQACSPNPRNQSPTKEEDFVDYQEIK